MPRATTKVEKEVVNTYEQLVAAGGGIALLIFYSPGRQAAKSGYSVYRVGVDGREIMTNKNAQWYEYKRKTFHWFGSTREETGEKAIQWVADTYQYTGTWVRNRFGDYVLKDINRRFPLRKKS